MKSARSVIVMFGKDCVWLPVHTAENENVQLSFSINVGPRHFPPLTAQILSLTAMWLDLFFSLVQIRLCRRWAPAPRRGNPVTPVWTRPRRATSTRRVNASDRPTTLSAARPRPLSPLWPIRSRAVGKDVRRSVHKYLFIFLIFMFYLRYQTQETRSVWGNVGEILQEFISSLKLLFVRR